MMIQAGKCDSQRWLLSAGSIGDAPIELQPPACPPNGRTFGTTNPSNASGLSSRQRGFVSPLSHLVAETVAGRTPCGNGVRSDALARADLQSGRDRADLPHDRIEVSSRNGSNGALHATLKRRLSILPSSKMKESTARRT